jgi:hypothetical protein
LVFLSGLACTALLLGTNQRARHIALTEKTERLERERNQQGLLAAATERARIAREMHDVIAHGLTVMVSLADGAAAKLRSKPEQAAVAIGNVSEIAVKRWAIPAGCSACCAPTVPPSGLPPQPGVAQIEELLALVRATGLAASLNVQGPARAGSRPN